MGNSISVRNIDPVDWNWLQHEALESGLSVAELVRRLIRDGRAAHERRKMPSEVFARHFGPENGIESLPLSKYGYRPIKFADE